jgi:periplasmic divalent cation tolerance protein
MPTVYVTAPRAEAPSIASRLVDERLAACVNEVPCRSTYRWEGEVAEDEESILLAKTSEERYDALVDLIETIHPHEVPCIERFDEDDVLPAFGEWIDAETTEED